MNALFSQRLIDWQKKHGRHHLPWQVKDPYCIWISEIMLQQTQVAAVQNYYPRFIARFPNVASLALAQEDEVLALWSGLGYYSRARNLHHAAKQIMGEFNGQFPPNRQQLQTLKGVGRSTAAAIAVFAFGQRETILDGNVRRVLCRVFALDGDVNQKSFIDKLWQLAEALLPANRHHLSSYIQGLMDLGATVCTPKPKCTVCPQQTACLAHQQGRVAQLPRKKKRICVRQVDLIWAILQDPSGAIMLEKRPSKGIWAGLFCVPCFDNPQQWQMFCDAFQFSASPNHALTPISHRLTHRLLNIQPYLFRLPEKRDDFYPLQEALNKGLPKPLVAQIKMLM